MGDSHTVTADWGDGSGPQPVDAQDLGAAGSGTATHVYVDNGTYTATVEVCDAEACDTHSTDVTVSNVAPVVDATLSLTAGELDLSAVVTDAGSADTHTATVDWGDGSAPEPAAVVGGPGGGTVAASHSYATDGDYTVSVCATDDDGAQGCDGGDVTVVGTNAPPSVTLDAVGPVAEGDAAAVTGTVSDPNVGDTLTVMVDPGDGSAAVPAVVDTVGGDLLRRCRLRRRCGVAVHGDGHRVRPVVGMCGRDRPGRRCPTRCRWWRRGGIAPVGWC